MQSVTRKAGAGWSYFRAFSHGSTPAKVVLLRRLHLSAVSSPVARSTRAPRSAAAAWLGVPPRANARAEPGNRTRRPARTQSSGVGNMNQFTFKFVDEQHTTVTPATATILNRTPRVEFAMAVTERPQNRLENYGAAALSDTELLAMALQGSGMRPELALQLAARLIVSAGSVAGLLSWKSEDYRRVKGIGPVKASQLSATAELARRMMIRSQPVAPLLYRADLVAAHLAPIVAGLEIEKFWVLCLTRKNRLLKQVEITSGTATAALAHPREVYRAAIRASATGIICAHNHPSGVMPHPILCRIASGFHWRDKRRHAA